MAKQLTEDQLKELVESVVDRWGGRPDALIMMLHAIQDEFGYIPRRVSLYLSQKTGIPLAQIYEVITFYHLFRTSPPGKHKISVCMGTACYLKGAPQIVEKLKEILEIKEGESTPDGLFQLETVRCLGCCGLAPVVMIDDKVYGKVNPEKIMDILAQYTKEQDSK